MEPLNPAMQILYISFDPRFKFFVVLFEKILVGDDGKEPFKGILCPLMVSVS